STSHRPVSRNRRCSGRLARFWSLPRPHVRLRGELFRALPHHPPAGGSRDCTRVGASRVVAIAGEIAVSDAYRIVRTPRAGGILVIADHASNRVPDDIELGIDPALMHEHIAVDVGVAGIAERMAQNEGTAAFLGNVSRLVCDTNREEYD